MHTFDQSLAGAYYVAELRQQARQAADARTLRRRSNPLARVRRTLLNR